MKVLVTGSAGHIGRPVCRELLRRGHQVRALDRVPTPGLGDALVADIADQAPVCEAVRGVDVVIHLAAHPGEAEISALVGPNVIGLYNVMNAAREQKVARVVLASSVMVVADRKAPPPLRTDEVWPRTHYALTKLLAEQMGEMYARCYGMNVLAARIGWMVRNPAEAHKLRELDVPDLYISGRDVGRFFARAAEAGTRGYAVVYALGRGGERLYDMEAARRLIGYEARDRWPDGLSYELPNAELAADPDVRSKV